MNEQEIIDYCLTKEVAYIDFPFGERPLCVKLCGKVAVQVYDGKITLKCEPSFGIPLRSKYEGTVVRGYHCPVAQQPYFNTVFLNGTIPDSELLVMIDHAFEAVKNKLPKKSRRDCMNVIDEYISQFKGETLVRLKAIKETIKTAAPDATEKISYRMPTFFLKGNLVHFAAFKNHIGFFPGASGVEAFLSRLDGYKTSKGTIQFQNSERLPLELITEIVKFRVAENTAKKAVKACIFTE